MAGRSAHRITDPAEIVLSSADAAALLTVTPEWLRRLTKDGWIKKLGKDRYRVIDVVQGHIRYMKDEARRASKTASATRVQDARASQIELAVAREQRDLIEIEDVQAVLSETLGTLRSELSGLPAACTRDLGLREVIEKNLHDIIDRCRVTFDAASKAAGDRKPIINESEGTDA